MSCEGVFCLDKSVVIEGTETFGYKPNNNSIDNRFGEGEKTNQTQPTNDILNSNCGEIGSKVWRDSGQFIDFHVKTNDVNFVLFITVL